MSDEITKKQVNIKIKPPPKDPGFEITHDHRENQLVLLHLYKGKVSALDLYESGKTIMFRLKIQFVGNLAKYIPIDAVTAKETIETVDIDLELLEVFFKKRESAQSIRAMFSPLVDKYPGVNIGQLVGTLKVNYGIFTEFVNFIQFLSYEPFRKDVKV